MYEATANAYAEMMDGEISATVYADILGRTAKAIADKPGVLIDTACGSGHMLARYVTEFEPGRAVVGVDLSPQMVDITQARLGAKHTTTLGDMRHLEGIPDAQAAGLLNFFALHHLDPDGIHTALGEWYRVLAPGGFLSLATWEGQGAIDYGGQADITALRYTRGQIQTWVTQAGFEVSAVRSTPLTACPWTRCIWKPPDGSNRTTRPFSLPATANKRAASGQYQFMRAGS